VNLIDTDTLKCSEHPLGVVALRDQLIDLIEATPPGSGPMALSRRTLDEVMLQIYNTKPLDEAFDALTAPEEQWLDAVVFMILNQLMVSEMEVAAAWRTMYPEEDAFIGLKTLLKPALTYQDALVALDSICVSTGPFMQGRVLDAATADDAFSKLCSIATKGAYGDLSCVQEMPTFRQYLASGAHEKAHFDVYVNQGNVLVFRGVNHPWAQIRHGDYVTLSDAAARWYSRGPFGCVLCDWIPWDDLRVAEISPDSARGSELVVHNPDLKRAGGAKIVGGPWDSYESFVKTIKKDCHDFVWN
jgi:hypothetical protein